MKGWIGVDLDGTLAEYDGWKGTEHIGDPIKPMVDRVKKWIGEGKIVRIFTARVYDDRNGDISEIIMKWTEKHIGLRLDVTCTKDYGMVELWDDRAVQVIPNTGIRADGK
jgi:hypothetical protein